MDIFLLYLLMQADAFGVVVFLAAVVCGVSAVVCMIAESDSSGDEEKEFRRWRKRWLNILVCAAIFLAIFPSTKTIAVMVGGHYALEAAKTDTGKKIEKFVNDTLNKAIEKINSK